MRFGILSLCLALVIGILIGMVGKAKITETYNSVASKATEVAGVTAPIVSKCQEAMDRYNEYKIGLYQKPYVGLETVSNNLVIDCYEEFRLNRVSRNNGFYTLQGIQINFLK